jgi:hypothetical protein
MDGLTGSFDKNDAFLPLRENLVSIALVTYIRSRQQAPC